MTISPELLNLHMVLPEIFLALAAMLILIIGVFKGDESTAQISMLSNLALLGTLGLVFLAPSLYSDLALNGFFIDDLYARFLKVVILLGLIACITISVNSLEIRGIKRFEYPVLILLSALGMMIMVSANHMIVLYMGLELQSLCLYVLAALQRGSAKSSEAGLKYFILGALSSGILLFGVSLIYGFTGSLYFPEISAVVEQGRLSPGLVTGLVFVLAALAFKISAVPFHMWTPDVYEGAPTPVTALFVIVPKVAAVGLTMRLLFDAFGAAVFEWSQILLVLSFASMIWGAFAALVQDNIKRLLAYSSIGNMGYALIGLVPGTEQGVSSVLFYMTIYMVMTAGLFACILRLQRDDIEIKSISKMAGLVKTNPVIAYLIAIFMFSMSGLPPLAGFFAKLVVFQAAVASGYYVLAIVGVVTSVVAAAYYLRIIKVILFDEPGDSLDEEDALSRNVVAVICAVLVIVFILQPDFLLNLTNMAAGSLLG